MIFNNKFEINYEGKLPLNKYSLLNSWCTVNKGILIMANNFFFEAEADEDAIIFVIVEPQSKSK